MKLAHVKDKRQLNGLICLQDNNQLLQSWEWGEFQKNAGNKVMKLGVEGGGEMIAAATLIKKTLPLGKGYFYCPRGPVVKLSSVAEAMEDKEVRSNLPAGEAGKLEVLEFLFNEIGKIADEEGVIFLRFEPIHELQIMDHELQIQKTIDVQPSKTLVLDLSKSEEELLKDMHQKTRYNIRLAERKGVKIVETQNIASDFEKFWGLMTETVERDGFRLHSRGYYERMLNIDNRNNQDGRLKSPAPELKLGRKGGLQIKLFLAKYQNKVITANIVSFFGNMVTYMHGASSNEYRNVMAPYLLQWHIIKLAKHLGYKYYDFYGIDEKKWPGVTRFKKGFGGDTIKYPGTFDLVFDKMWYSLYRISRRLRRMV